MCQFFLDHAFTPIFSALYFCTFYSTTTLTLAEFFRHVLQFKNLTEKYRVPYLKLFISFPTAVEWAVYRLTLPCFVPIDGRVGWRRNSVIRTILFTIRCSLLLLC